MTAPLLSCPVGKSLVTPAGAVIPDPARPAQPDPSPRQQLCRATHGRRAGRGTDVREERHRCL